MSGPSLVVLFPTTREPSPSSTASSSANHSAVTFTEQDRRTSTETQATIFSIYSMYGNNDVNSGKSIPAQVPVTPTIQQRPSNGTAPPIIGHRSSAHRTSSNRPTTSETVYLDNSLKSRSSSRYASPSEESSRASLTTNGSVHLSYLDDRPLSKASSFNNYHKSLDTVRLSQYKDLPPGPSSVSYIPPAGAGSTDYHASPSAQRQSATDNGVSSKPSPKTSLRLSPTPSRMRTLELLPPPTPPRTPQPSPKYLGSSGSKSSLVPSGGEDVDAFHVRNTYAELEMTGVKGDGYVEGIERTRARVGGNRQSELRAEEAVDDGSEKTRELSPEELRTLASLDRYGFFSIPSHDRLILLASAPLSKRLSKAPAGPKTASPSAKSLSSLPPYTPSGKETTRISKWGRMLEPRARDQGGNVESWGIKSSKEQKLQERIYKGIPDRWRSAAWDLLMSRFSKTGRGETDRLGRDYRDALEKPSTYDIQIDLDVPRTISGHIMFRTRYGSGQRSLFHVLHSFSLRCPQCGYVQGMGPIAATLLCYFEPERVYACLVRLHDAYAMHTIFSPGFPGLLEAIYVQERITEQMMPDVYSAFKNNMISTTSYATKWYITLFANSVPFQTQLRLWDVFLLEGDDLFIAVAIAIVWIYRDNITSAAANFETVLSLLSSFFVPEDEDALLSWIEKMLGNKKLRTSMTRWRQEWRNLVATGKEGEVLL